MAGGRQIGSRNGVVMYESDIPDDHTCKQCYRTKSEGAGFKAQHLNGKFQIARKCNSCYAKQNRFKMLTIDMSVYDIKLLRRTQFALKWHSMEWI